MGDLNSWTGLRAAFAGCASEYDVLSAEYDPLLPGHWILGKGSPRSHRKFKDLGGAAAAKLYSPGVEENGEPWQVWLGYMWAEGWRRPETAPTSPEASAPPGGRLPWPVLRGRLEQDDRTIWRLFQTSADCCRDIEERDRSESSRAETPEFAVKLELTQNQKDSIASVDQDLTNGLIAHGTSPDQAAESTPTIVTPFQSELERKPSVRDPLADPALRPLPWSRIQKERTSKTSTFVAVVANQHVGFSIPAHHTHRDVVVRIATESQIPIESLGDELDQPIFNRGQTIFAYVGDALDAIARNYPLMRWWISDRGLNMAIVSFDEALDLPGPTDERLDAVVKSDRKGDIKLLERADGSQYESVDFPTAEGYAGVTPRRRQQLMKDGTLALIGKGMNRRITVESLPAYCPPKEDAN